MKIFTSMMILFVACVNGAWSGLASEWPSFVVAWRAVDAQESTGFGCFRSCDGEGFLRLRFSNWLVLS